MQHEGHKNRREGRMDGAHSFAQKKNKRNYVYLSTAIINEKKGSVFDGKKTTNPGGDGGTKFALM